MAWTCIRCMKRIFMPRKYAYRYAMHWRYIKSRGELTADMKNLKVLKDGAVVTHLQCDGIDDGFEDRMRKALEMPQDSIHPLL